MMSFTNTEFERAQVFDFTACSSATKDGMYLGGLYRRYLGPTSRGQGRQSIFTMEDRSGPALCLSTTAFCKQQSTTLGGDEGIDPVFPGGIPDHWSRTASRALHMAARHGLAIVFERPLWHGSH